MFFFKPEKSNVPPAASPSVSETIAESILSHAMGGCDTTSLVKRATLKPLYRLLRWTNVIDVVKVLWNPKLLRRCRRCLRFLILLYGYGANNVPILNHLRYNFVHEIRYLVKFKHYCFTTICICVWETLFESVPSAPQSIFIWLGRTRRKRTKLALILLAISTVLLPVLHAEACNLQMHEKC